jgi:hypothetical protein
MKINESVYHACRHSPHCIVAEGGTKDVFGWTYTQNCLLVLRKVPNLSDAIYISFLKGAKEMWWCRDFYDNIYYCAIIHGSVINNEVVKHSWFDNFKL